MIYKLFILIEIKLKNNQMNSDQVQNLIQKGIKDSLVEVIDTTGTNDHFSVIVVSDSFIGLSLIEQHQMVYKSVGDHMTKEIHALEIKTLTQDAWKKKN